MAKRQKRSNREVRKPKQARPKAPAPATSVLGIAGLGAGKSPDGPKAARK
jgi:hypothetical protein